MRLAKCLTVLHALLAMAVCAYGQDVHDNYDRDTNFAFYKTYRWISLSGGVGEELIDRDFKRLIDEQLAQKSLTRVEKDANLYVGFEAAIDVEKSADLRSTGLGSLRGWGDHTVEGQTSTIPIGMPLLSLYDPAKRRLIWRGDASKAIDLKKDPDDNYRNLQKAMAKLLKSYPPQGGK